MSAVDPQVMLAVVGTWFEGNPMAKLYLGLVGFDTLSGLLRAAKEREINSSIGTNGLMRKLGVVLGIGLSEVLEPFLGVPLLSEIAASGFCVMEGLSIVENLGKVGVTMPVVVTDALSKLTPNQKPPAGGPPRA